LECAELRTLKSSLPGLLALLPPALAAFAQRGILFSDFKSDDFIHFFRIVNFGFQDFVVQSYGGHLQVVRNAIFFLKHGLFGLDPLPYFAVVLTTHIVNTFLLYHVLQRLSRSPHLAVFLASIWGMSPLNQEALSWYSVYGQVLGSTVLLILLYTTLSRREEKTAPSSSRIAGWLSLLVILSLAFGTGLAVAVTALLWLPLLLPARYVQRRLIVSLASLAVALPLLYIALHAWSPPISPNAGDLGLQLSSLDPTKWALAASFGFDLASFGFANLLLGPFITADLGGVVVGPFQGAAISSVLRVSQLLFLVLAIAFLLLLFRAPSQERRSLLACACVVAASYGVIAIGRSILYDSMQWPLWMGAVVPRYHYLPSLTLSLLLGSMLAAIHMDGKVSLARFFPYLWLAGTLGLYTSACRDLDFPNRRDGRADFERATRIIRNAIERGEPGEDVFIRNREFASIDRWLASGDFFPDWAGIFIIAFPDNVVDGKRIFFIEDDATRIAIASRWPETRIARLLVAEAP